MGSHKDGRVSLTTLAVSILTAVMLGIPIFMASATLLEQIDKTALERRIAMLEEKTVASPDDLQRQYRELQIRYLPTLPPGPHGYFDYIQTIVVFDPKDFPGWIDALESEEMHGVKVYPVIVGEDTKTRDTVFLNSLWEEIASIPAEKSYDPFTLLAAWKLDLFIEYAAPDVQAWYMASYDPARICATYFLLPIEDVPAMAEAQLAESMEAAEERASQPAMRMMMGEGMPAPVTNLVFFAIEQVTNGMALGIGWQDDFTNNLEIFARASIASTGWFVVSSNLSTLGTNSLWWVDTTIASGTPSRFYRAGNADLDSDDDGLTDARERMIWGTYESEVDSDNDGFNDYQEAIELHTDPNNDDTNKPAVTINFPANNGAWIWMP